jgi:hypothetical protein
MEPEGQLPCPQQPPVALILSHMNPVHTGHSVSLTSALGSFAKLQMQTVIFVMSVCLSVCPSTWSNSAPTGWIFMKFDILYIFRKSVEEIQVY